jgi:D-alanyl-D-alanine carboxypeptidase/D-alanyl-D-alanine-endopeptidase (penicillin-binding protein 4)
MMMRTPLCTIVVLLALLLGGCASTRLSDHDRPAGMASLLSRASTPELKREIDRLLPDSLFPPAIAGVRIVHALSGEPLYELNTDLLLIPASNQKILTAAAALAFLGPDYRFTTVMRVDTTGDPTITITGAGDPLLMSADLDTMSAIIAALLPQKSGWTLAGDISAFDDEPWGKGWMWDDEPDPTAMEISPLSVDRNCIAVRAHPGKRPGDPLEIVLDPATGVVAVANDGFSTADSVRAPLHVTRSRGTGANLVRVSGEMRLGDTTMTRRVSVSEPARYFLDLLAERLRSAGVAIATVRIDTLPAAGDSIVLRVHSLDSVVTFMNRWSDNLSAECLVKVMGRQLLGGRGSGTAGTQAMRDVLGRMGIDTVTTVCADGSGVSRYNLTSVRTITDLLSAVSRDTAMFPLFLQSLPAAGEPGTLQTRLRGTRAQGVVRAKTGTMTGVTALSGYVRSADGELLAFSLLFQNYPGEARRYRAVQDGICVYLASFRR